MEEFPSVSEFPSGDLSLTEEQGTGDLSLTGLGPTIAVPQEVAQPRALKAHIGLGKISPGVETLTAGIANGQEPQMRQDLALVQAASLRDQKMSALQWMAQQPNPDMDHAKALLDWQPNPDPTTLFEKNFGREYTTKVANNEPNVVQEALQQDTEGAHKLLDVTQDLIANQESFKKITQETEDYFSSQNLGMKRKQFTGTLWPFASAAMLRNIVAVTPSLLPGNNLEEQITLLWSLPPEQAARAFQKAVDELKVINPLDALTFAKAVTQYSESDRFLNNITAIADATIVGGPLLKLGKLMKGALKGNAPEKLNIGNTLEAVGDIEKAADVKAVEQATAKSQEPVMPVVDRGFDPLGQQLDLTSTIPSFYNPKVLQIPTIQGPEKIASAAYKVGDRVFQAPIHAVARDDAMAALGLKRERDLIDAQPGENLSEKLKANSNAEGFVTSTGRFVGREEAQEIAKKQNQFAEGKKGDRLGGLNAEDLAAGGKPQPVTSAGLGSLSRERAARIEGALIEQNRLIEETLPGLARVSRMPQNELEVGLARAKERLEEQFNHIQDAVLDVRNGSTGNFTPGKQIISDFLSSGKRNAWIDVPEGKMYLRQHNGTIDVANLDFETKGTGAFSQYLRHLEDAVLEGKAKTIRVENIYNDRLISFLENRGYVREGSSTPPTYRMDFNRLSILERSSEKGRQNIPGFEHLPAEKTRTNVDYVLMNVGKEGKEVKAVNDLGFPGGPIDEVVIGKTDATLFKSYEEANNTALRDYGLNYKQFQVVEGPGNKWYISIPTAVDETDTAIRSMKLETTNMNNDSMVNYYLGYLRTPADQVSQFVRNNRLLATTAPTEIHKLIKEIAKPLLDLQQYPKGTQTVSNALLGKASWSKLNDVLEYYRDFVDYSKENSRGKWPTSFAELEKDWKKVTGKLPNQREQIAFWTTVKLNDLDYVLRNYNLHRDLARQGIEHIGIPLKEGGFSDPILGKVVENSKFPWSNPEDAVLAVFKNNEWSYHSKNNKGSTEVEALKAWMEKPSVKIVQVANPDDRPLKGILDRNPHFIVTEDIQRSPLPIKLVDYNPGGHVIYPQQWYAKQPIVEQGLYGRWYHYGDQTIMPFYTRAQAEKYTPKLDEFRQMLKKGASDAALDAFVQKNLPKDVEFWKSKFSGTNAILSLDHPIIITNRNSTTFRTNPALKELYKDKLGQDVVSYPESSYNLSTGIDKSFLQDRNGPLMSIKGPGINPWNPVYKLETSPVLKPLFAMERGLYNAVKGLYMNDVKTSTIEQWIKQYGPVLKDPLDKVQRNPYYQFYHGPLVPQDDANYRFVQGAENSRRNLSNFLRTSSDLNQDINIANEKVAERLFKVTGESDTAANWYASHDWHLIKHPIDFLRSFNTDIKFGFFNLPQAAIQTAGAFHAIALSPLKGLAGSNAAFLHYMQVMAENHLPEKVADGVLSILDRSAISGGWKKGQFTESVQTMNRTGYFNVGREVAWRESISDPQLYLTQYQKFLDKSYVFFNFGERNNRLVAWHTSFKEWRDANPDKAITDRVVGEIMNRASLLNADMLRESNSAMQKGILGVSTQFQSFRMRIAEQFMGQRLTNYEKARALGVSSILWGIPVTLSAYGVPWAKIPGGVEGFYDDVRKYAMDNGITLDNKYLKVLHEGIIDIATNYVTGSEHSIAKRLGPGVDTSISEMFNGIKDALQIALGPTGTMVESIGKAVLPFYAGLYTAIRGGQEQYAITHDEVLDVAREISSVNNLYNGIMAWNYQKYVGKNKDIVKSDMTKTDAVMNVLLGATRKDISDTRLQQSLLHDQAQVEAKVGKWALEEFRKMYQALDSENPDFAKADKYLANAKTYMVVFGDFSEDKQQKIANQATSEFGTLAERINRQFYDPAKIPLSKMPARLKAHFGIDLQGTR